MSGLTKKELGIAGLIIIALGIGLYYKVMIPRRENLRVQSCLSNLKTIGWAMRQYTQDYNGTLPRTWFGKDAGPSNTKDNYKWMDAIFPYVKNESIFSCSFDTVNKPYRFRSGTNYGSYIMNNAYSAPGDPYSPPSGKALASVYWDTILILEGHGDFQFTWSGVNSTPEWKISRGSNFLGTIQALHKDGKFAYLTIDGSRDTKWLSEIARARNLKESLVYTSFTIEVD